MLQSKHINIYTEYYRHSFSFFFRKSFLFIWLCFFCFTGRSLHAQQIDSLLLIFQKTKTDTEQVLVGARLSWEYRAIGDYKQALEYGEKSLAKAEKIGFKNGTASACNALGAIYDEQGNYPKSLLYYTRSMKLHEELHDETGICRDYNNIGLLYENLSNYQTALDYYQKALAIAEKQQDKRNMSAIYFNIGAVNTYINRYDISSEFYFKSLEIDKQLKDDIAISDCYTNIGINYTYLSQYDKALDYCHMGVKMKQELNDQNGVASGLINIADIYLRLRKYDESKSYLQKALVIAEQIGSVDNLRLVYEGLANVNALTSNYKDAYDYHVKFKQLTDSLFNSENNEQLNQIKINYELDKKEAEQIQLKALADADKKRQNIIILAVAFGLLIVSVFSVFLYKRFKVTTQQKQIISEQKELVEEKQKEITDSINYAKRIQTSFLASHKDFEAQLSDYFILFKPKDVVSGDFYWATRQSDKLFVCVADSTGHGIPGAFMSLLNISLLNEAVLSKDLSSTAEILNFVRRILILGLKPDEAGQGGNDGMDCVLYIIDFDKMELSFSGAHNPLWIISQGELIELRPDKMPVGRSPLQDTPFTSQTVSIQKGDRIYGFTDGYADQFGGPKGKKFKYKQLEGILLAFDEKSMTEQERILDQSFEAWRGNLEQVDDVCIVGIKI